MASDDGGVETQWNECIGSFNVTQGLTTMSSPHVFFPSFPQGPAGLKGGEGPQGPPGPVVSIQLAYFTVPLGSLLTKKTVSLLAVLDFLYNISYLICVID